MVRAITGGHHGWNYTRAGMECQQAFLLIVAKSLAALPGEFIGGTQIAETFNGATPAEIKDEITHWRDVISRAIENAFRAAHTLGIRLENSDYTVETEKEISFRKDGETYNGKIDVLIQSRARTTILDWSAIALMTRTSLRFADIWIPSASPKGSRPRRSLVLRSIYCAMTSCG